MKIEPIILLENSLKQNEYKQRKKIVKKRNKEFKDYLLIEMDRKNMYER